MRRQSDVGYLPAADDGPLVAGGLIRWDLLGASWRLIFFINLLLGAAAITAGLRYLPADGPATLRRLDGRGVAISAAAVPTRLPADPGPPGWLAMVDVRPPRGTGLFARHERRSAAPLIEPALLRRRTYLAGSAVALAFFAASAGIMLVLSSTPSTASDTAPSVPGPMLTPAAAGNVTGALAAMRLTRRLDGRATIQVNLAVAAAGLARITSPAGSRPGGLILAGPILALGFGLGGTSPLSSPPSSRALRPPRPTAPQDPSAPSSNSPDRSESPPSRPSTPPPATPPAAAWSSPPSPPSASSSPEPCSPFPATSPPHRRRRPARSELTRATAGILPANIRPRPSSS